MADLRIRAASGEFRAMREIEQRIEDEVFDAAVEAVRGVSEEDIVLRLIRDAQDTRRRARMEGVS